LKNTIAYTLFWYLVSIFFVLTAFPTFAFAEKAQGSNVRPGPRIGWSVFSRGGFVHQFDTNIDNGGSFSVNRLFIQGGPSYTTEGKTSISLAVGYGLDAYDFSGDAGLGGRQPWEDIQTLRFSIPLRWRASEKWTGFAAPTLRFTGENGADYSDSMVGGGFAGFSYRVSDRLSIGPGIGVLTQLEDSTTVIPILVINWKMTDTLSLNTGQGIGATLGPGLTIDWQPSSTWTFSIGGRYEHLRFRLADDGTVPNGIGDDRSFPIFGGVQYSFSPKVRISAVAGVEVGGKLRLEDESGNNIIEENHDAAGFLGVAFSARF
jgi:hypothetical protein